jgi:hypothetical protein
MSLEPNLIIAGNNDLATDAARHAMSADFGDPVYLWRTVEDPIVGVAPVVVLADPAQRPELAAAAIRAGLDVVSLPIEDPSSDLVEALAAGNLKLMSSLHGLPTMARLRVDCQAGRYGRRYGVYAARRLPRNFGVDVRHALADLGVYVSSLIDSQLERIQVTRSDQNGTPAWFILARFSDETIATLEVAALLPDADEPNGELLVEVTGSDAVLRAEPERQSIFVSGNAGIQRQSWYADPAEYLLRYARTLRDESEIERHLSAMRLLQHLDEAARSDEAVSGVLD